MKYNMDNDITLYNPISNKDFLFIHECINGDLYNQFIMKNIENINNILIISHRDNKCGIFYVDLETINNFNIVKPIIYIKYRMSSTSLFAIFECLKYLAFDMNSSLIVIPVYRCNRPMLRVIEHLHITYNGAFKVQKNDIADEDLLFFSIDKQGIDNFKKNSQNLLL